MSAVPTFKQITQALVEYEYLVPKLSKKEKAELAREEEALTSSSKECVSNRLDPITKVCKPKNIYKKKKYRVKKIKKIKIYKPIMKKIRPKVYKKPVRVKKQEPLFNDLDMF
jgi:hypothetical protein